MTPTYVIALMVLLFAMSHEIPKWFYGYACPNCGTKRPEAHSDGCPMKKEDE